MYGISDQQEEKRFLKDRRNKEFTQSFFGLKDTNLFFFGKLVQKGNSQR